jgi:NADH-quinone oxidoreductase subunit F
VADLLGDLEDGRGEAGDLDRLASHARLLAPGHTYCALAPGAAEPLQSALTHFRDDFERHIREHRCPWQ